MRLKHSTRRDFIGNAMAAAGFGAMGGCASPVASAAGGRWYRGQLHTHTFWSDGRAFPEEAVMWYKSRGYHFLSLTDHNQFQRNPNRWIRVFPEDAKPLDGKKNRRRKGPLSEKHLDRYLKAFPDAEVRTGEDGIRQVRLKTYGELAAKFERPGEFLLMPGMEASRYVKYADGAVRYLHMNYINLPGLLHSYRQKGLREEIADRAVEKAIADHFAETEALAGEFARKYLFILNHPLWVWYDIPPSALVENHQVRFFELCNSGSNHCPPDCVPGDGFDGDRFWDVVNAFRARSGQPLLYGVGTDDTHYYHGEPYKMGQPGDAWISVRANSLNADSLISAMNRGDFVACAGIGVDDVVFSPVTSTLEVSVAASPGKVRTIHFIVTKKDFSGKPLKTFSVTPSTPTADKVRLRRKLDIYDSRIGMTVKSAQSGVGKTLRASYTMAADDLYVRARIEEDGVPVCPVHLHPRKLVAWTQPYSK